MAPTDDDTASVTAATAFQIVSAIVSASSTADDGGLCERAVESAVDAGFEAAATVSVTGSVTATTSSSVDDGVVDSFDHPATVSDCLLGETDVLGVPIVEENRRFGTLVLEPARSVSPDVYSDFQTVGRALGNRLAASSRAAETVVESQQRTFRKLHSVATQMVGADSEDGVFHLAIDAAENILEFDTCTIDVEEDGYFRPVATSSGIPSGQSERVPVDQGLAGETYRTERSIVVDDARDAPDVAPVEEAFRSILSVPIEGVGVFQAATTEPGAFDEADADLAELLLSYVSQTICRIRSAAALRENEQRYRTLVEQSHDAVLTVRDDVVTFANQRATALFGYDRSDLEGLTVWDLAHSSSRDRLREFGRDLMDGVRDTVRFEGDIVRADGERRECEFSVSRILDRDDPLAMVTVRDITERRAYEQRLERQNQRLDEFASVVSHDLRNPLSVASGRVELARETGDLSHLGDASAALDRMNDLVDDVLTWARQGRSVDDPEQLDVATVARRAWETTETADATVDIDLDGFVLEADRGRLRRLFENLYRNSVEHGGEQVAVTVGRIDDGFFVEDDGEGIAADLREKVFERGFTTVTDGTGFGLAIVRDVVEAHGWTIEAVPSGTGARFEIRTGENE